MKHKARRALQYAALPWRIREGGLREVMLLTTRETHRWVIPKGWPMKGRKPAEVAGQEAYEEAGLIGQIVGKRPLGNFHYEKRLAKKVILCEVGSFCSEWSDSSRTGRRRARASANGSTRGRRQP